jgi:phosphate transport system substrate-binding protein
MIRRVGGLAAIAVALIACIALTATAASAGITGAGSTLIAPLWTFWDSYIESTDSIPTSSSATGSADGVKEVSSRTVDIGASDVPLSATSALACDGCVQIPWALTAVAVPFHVGNVKRLRLTGRILAGIYPGRDQELGQPCDQEAQPQRRPP